MSAAAPLQNTAAKPQPLSSSTQAGLLLQRKCACGSPTSSLTGECAECKSKKPLQTKLTIGASNDPLEQEADRVAEQVLAASSNPAVRGTPPRIQRFTAQATRQTDSAPASVDHVLAESGKPLGTALRQDMEQRFGHDFSRVRVHSGAAAEQSARDVKAHAYTVGHNIVFGESRFAPGTQEGRRLLAHELAHTVQQSCGGIAIQRFVSCTRARLSGEECPQRKEGEATEWQHEPMIVEFIDKPEVGYLIGNFDVGKSSLKASGTSHSNWPQLVKTVTQPGSLWQIWGLSDCQGSKSKNASLRQQRADAVSAVLPTAATAHIVGASGASLHECITDNTTPADRAWNRAVLITAVRTKMDFEPIEIEGTRPKSKIEKADTEGCDKPQRDALARAFALAKQMVRVAIGAIDDETLMKQYFGEDMLAHRNHIRQNFVSILDGLKWGPTFECREADSWICDGAHARVIPIVGLNIHICPSAIALGDNFLARTIVHECAHGYAFVFVPDELCAGGWPSSKDTTDAEDNADCYGEFAGDALAKFP